MWESLGIKNEHRYTFKLAIQSEKTDIGRPTSERIQFIDSKILAKKILKVEYGYCGY